MSSFTFSPSFWPTLPEAGRTEKSNQLALTEWRWHMWALTPSCESKCQRKTLCSSNPCIPQCTPFPTLPRHTTALLPVSLVNIFLSTTTSDVPDLQLGYKGPWYSQFLWVSGIACGFLHSYQWLDLCHCQISQTYNELDSPLCTSDSLYGTRAGHAGGGRCWASPCLTTFYP